jgi:hypothetical protein
MARLLRLDILDFLYDQHQSGRDILVGVARYGYFLLEKKK